MSQIDEVRDRIDIVELIRDSGVVLQKAGRNYKACCPFHAEKTPSFIVFPDRQNWRCFGACAEGGDAFSFVMKRENAGFGDALRSLAARAGVELQGRDSGPTDDEKQARERLHTAVKAAGEFFAEQLQRHPAAGPVRDYLEHRHLAVATIAAFQLGFAPDDFHALDHHLTAIGFSQAELLEAGLLTENENGRRYDRFRNKLMIPIADREGRPIGFGARVLDGSQPKYLNSPQTPLFDKSATLYGLDRAREAIRQTGEAVLVEGYMDAIMAHQHGFTNVVATLGTALTDRHVTTLKRLTKRIKLCLDGDDAGVNAMLRGYEVARDAFDQVSTAVPTARGLIRYQTTADADIRVVVLPWGKDPDDVIHEDPSVWKRLVFDAQPVIDFIFGVTFKAHSNRDAEGKRAIVDALAPIVNDIPDPVVRAHYLQRMATAVQLDERQLAAYVASRRPNPRRRDTAPAEPVAFRQRDKLEEAALALLLRYTSLRVSGGALSAELFERPDNRALFVAWQGTPDVDALAETLEPSVADQFAIVLNSQTPPLDGAALETDFKQTIRRLEERLHRRRFDSMSALLTEVEASGSADLLARQAWEARDGDLPDMSDDLRQALDVQRQALTQAHGLKALFHQRSSGETRGAG